MKHRNISYYINHLFGHAQHYKEYPLHNNLIILYILFKLHNRFRISERKYPVGMMNRLDIETSGVVFVAKNQVGYDKLFIPIKRIFVKYIYVLQIIIT